MCYCVTTGERTRQKSHEDFQGTRVEKTRIKKFYFLALRERATMWSQGDENSSLQQPAHGREEKLFPGFTLPPPLLPHHTVVSSERFFLLFKSFPCNNNMKLLVGVLSCDMEEIWKFVWYFRLRSSRFSIQFYCYLNDISRKLSCFLCHRGERIYFVENNFHAIFAPRLRIYRECECIWTFRSGGWNSFIAPIFFYYSSQFSFFV